jgi:serine/threonine protein kinase
LFYIEKKEISNLKEISVLKEIIDPSGTNKEKMKIDKYIPLETDLSRFKKIVKIGQGSFGEVNLVRLTDQSKSDMHNIRNNMNEENNNMIDMIENENENLGSKKQNKVFFAMKRTLSKSSHKLRDNEWEKEYTILSMLCHKFIIQPHYLFKTTENGLVNGIPNVFGGINDTITCLIMEYFPGCDLQKFIIKNQKLSLEKGITYSMPIKDQLIISKSLLDVIQYLHSMGISHRDIKPSNIMYNEKTGQIKLIDFSFAVYCLDYPTTPEQYEYLVDFKINKGTPLYMPRELIFNQDDILGVQNRSDIFKSDIWALGVSLYYMFAGFEPYNASTYKEFRRLMKDPPRPIYGIYHTPPEIEQLCQDCLMVRYQDRPDIDILHAYFMPKLNNIEVIKDEFGNEIYKNKINSNNNNNNNNNNNISKNENELMMFDFNVTNFDYALISKNY